MTMLFFLLTAGLLSRLTQATCPEQCSCRYGDTDVDCSDKGLVDFPEDLQLNITKLNVSHNSLTSLGEDDLELFSRLVDLDLSGNLLENLPPRAFQNLTDLLHLYLHGNQLSSIHVDQFRGLDNLLTLDMSNNSLLDLPKKILENNYKLGQLRLSNNLLDNNVFDRLSDVVSLELLELSGNPLRALPYLVLSQSYNMQFLLLKECEISSIDNNAFVGLTELEYLDLSTNEITSLSREIFQPLGKWFLELDLSASPLKCSCSMKQLQDWILAKDVLLLNPAKCTAKIDEVDSQIDIKTGDFGGFCDVPAPTSPPPACSNFSIQVNVGDVSENSAVVEWIFVEHADENGFAQLFLRQFGEREFLAEEIVPAVGNLTEHRGLSPGTGYVFCVQFTPCGYQTCTEFETSSSAVPSNCPNLWLIVGATIGAAVFIIVIIIISMWCFACKRKVESMKTQKKVKSDVPMNGCVNIRRMSGERVAPTVTSPPQGDNPYEAINIGFTNHAYTYNTPDDMRNKSEYIPMGGTHGKRLGTDASDMEAGRLAVHTGTSAMIESSASNLSTVSSFTISDQYLTPFQITPVVHKGSTSTSDTPLSPGVTPRDLTRSASEDVINHAYEDAEVGNRNIADNSKTLTRKRSVSDSYEEPISLDSHGNSSNNFGKNLTGNSLTSSLRRPLPEVPDTRKANPHKTFPRQFKLRDCTDTAIVV